MAEFGRIADHTLNSERCCSSFSKFGDGEKEEPIVFQSLAYTPPKYSIIELIFILQLTIFYLLKTKRIMSLMI